MAYEASTMGANRRPPRICWCMPFVGRLLFSTSSFVTTSKARFSSSIYPIMSEISTSPKKLEGYAFYEAMGRPSKVVAPMVGQSELAYRMLCRRYGAELCYTPMYHAKQFTQSPLYKKENFSTAPEDRPLLVQFCANDPDILLTAAKMVEGECDGVDINLGCPQGIARKGNYGSFLLTETDLVCDMVSILHKNLSVPVTCKIRLLSTIEATLALCHRLVEAGCQLLCVHGRTKEEKKQFIGPCNWEAIRMIKEALPIPVIANGAVEDMDDVEKCMRETGVDGVMTSEAILENPGLFARNINPDTGAVMSNEELALEFLDFAERYPTGSKKLKAERPHIFKFLYCKFQVYPDMRPKCGQARTLDDLRAVVREIQQRVADDKKQGITHPDEPVSWYRRHAWQDASILGGCAGPWGPAAELKPRSSEKRAAPKSNDGKPAVVVAGGGGGDGSSPPAKRAHVVVEEGKEK